MFLVAIALICVSLLIPETAYAWGGGTHLLAGIEVLKRLDQIQPLIANILASHPNEYLYGCMAADIITGKKYTHYLLNCHRWRVGAMLLKAAGDDPQKACAWGYLSHLAADIVAHNYYVPYKTIRSFDTISLRHTYWEMRFESFIAPEIWLQARKVCLAGRPLDDALLRRVMVPTLFSFGTSKRIFNSILLLSRIERLQRLMKALSVRSRHTLTEADHTEYLKITIESVMDLLRNGDNSYCMLTDPTGASAIGTAMDIREHLRFLYKTGHISRKEGIERAESLKPILRKIIHEPELLQRLKKNSSPPTAAFSWAV